MPYSTQADIESLFGVENVKQWSNLDNAADEADTDRIAAAIVQADAEIDDIMRNSIYAVPLVGTQGTLTQITNISAKLAGCWLYRARGTNEVDEGGKPIDRMQAIRKEAMGKLYRYVAGAESLPAARSGSHQPTAPTVIG